MDPSTYRDFFFSFLSILLEGAPYILFGTIISGFIDAFLPANVMERLLPRNRTLAVLVSGLLGFVFPVCECAIIPVIRRLVQKGLPVACAVTYMLSAPVLNPIVIVSTFSAFKGDPVTMTVSRLLMAYLVTVFVGLVVSNFSNRSILKPNVFRGMAPAASRRLDAEDARAPIGDAGPADENAGAAPHPENDRSGEPGSSAPFGDKIIRALRTAQRDFLDTAMYFTIGVMLTSVFQQARYGAFQDVMTSLAGTDLYAVPLMMGLAFVLSLCSTTDAFIVAPMDLFSKVSKLAFLVYGPMMDVKLLFMYTSVFKPRFVISIVLGLFLLIGLLCIPWKLFVFS